MTTSYLTRKGPQSDTYNLTGVVSGITYNITDKNGNQITVRGPGYYEPTPYSVRLKP